MGMNQAVPCSTHAGEEVAFDGCGFGGELVGGLGLRFGGCRWDSIGLVEIDQFQFSVSVLHHRGGVLDPVAQVEIQRAFGIGIVRRWAESSHGWNVNVTADDRVAVVLASVLADFRLESADPLNHAFRGLF